MGNLVSIRRWITYGLKRTASKRPCNNYHAPDDTLCSICIDDLFDDISANETTTLICGHRFHTGCIKPWMRLKGTCPFCRRADNTTFPRTVAEVLTGYAEDISLHHTIHEAIVREIERNIMMISNTVFENEAIRLAESINQQHFDSTFGLRDAIMDRSIRVQHAIQRIMLPAMTITNAPTPDEHWEQLEPLL